MRSRRHVPSQHCILSFSKVYTLTNVKRFCYFLTLAICISATSGRAQIDDGSHNKRRQEKKEHFTTLRKQEVTFSAEVWGFARIYPLLDGLLQDISATQVATVALNPNAPNGTSVDAVQQSLQLQLQYSQMAGVQNSAAAQAATANSTYQTSLAQQETALMQQLSTAYSQVATAQANLNTLTASGTASATDIATATQALQSANANLTAVGTAITNFKNLAAPTVPTTAAPLATTPTLPALSASVLPSGLSTAGTSTAGGPSFPATKQMDNQINILWERLARLVGAMSRPDSMSPDDKIYLVRFDTGIYPVYRRKELLDVSYQLSCGGVIDLFPRNAALNIVEDKYRDSAFGFGAVLSWFGVGGSVAYNREHLKASQLLGQSSYITGHGIGQQKFGWLFGITLGDDSIAPGPRNTFALVWIPKGCGEPTITVESADWTEQPNFKLKFPEVDVSGAPKWLLKPTSDPEDTEVTSIEFNRNEYDPTANKPAPVTVRLTLSHDMDQQQTVTVDGQLIQRVRDNFGRAITPTVSGSNGVLETSQFGTNTWIPTSPTTLLITLDSSQFGNQFPQILLSSPEGVIDVSHSRTKAKVVVSGNVLGCAQLPCSLPSLGVLKTTPKNLGVARWMIDAGAGKQPIEKFCITVLDPQPGAAPLASAAGVPTVQVISDSDSQVWGSDVEVNVLSSDARTFRLICDPSLGSRLVCDAPPWEPDGSGKRPSTQLQLIDQHHVGGVSIKGTVSTKECSDAASSDQPCRLPLIWRTIAPKLAPNNTTDLSNSKWKMWVQLVNVDSSDKASLGDIKADLVNGHVFDCTAGPKSPCIASFTIGLGQLNIVSDWMSFGVTDDKDAELGSHAAITNVLTNIKPLISQITDDRTSWSGRNLVFNTVRVGNSQTFQVDCLPDGTQCKGDGKYGATAGFLYFVPAESLAFPFSQISATGTSTAVTYTPPKPLTTSTQKAAEVKPSTTPANTLDQNIPPELKQKMSMQAVQ